MALVSDINSSIMNSYVSISEAATYFSERGHGDAWDDVSDPAAMLISATNQIDWFMNFQGEKVSITQPLEWPRQYVYDRYGNELPNDEIPLRVKQAVLELAIASIDEDRLQDSDMAGLQEVKVGSLKVVSNMVGPWQDKKAPIPTVCYVILKDLISNSSSMFHNVVRG